MPDYDCEPWLPERDKNSGLILAKGTLCYPCFWARQKGRTRGEWPHWPAFLAKEWMPLSKKRQSKCCSLKGRRVQVNFPDRTFPQALRPFAGAVGVVVSEPKVLSLRANHLFKVQLILQATGEPLDVIKGVKRSFFTLIDAPDADAKVVEGA